MPRAPSLPRGSCSNEPAVAHDRRVRREREPFAEVVRDEHERRAARLERLEARRSARPHRPRRARCTARRAARLAGSCTIARAIETRCCIPRLSDRTGECARSSSRIRSSARIAASRGRCHAVQPRRELDVLERGERRVQHALMRDQADDGSGAAAPPGSSTPAIRALPLVGRSRPGEDAKQRRLPCPVGPEQREAFAIAHGET